eukprot:1426216-Rhodomonas_salina.1
MEHGKRPDKRDGWLEAADLHAAFQKLRQDWYEVHPGTAISAVRVKQYCNICSASAAVLQHLLCKSNSTATSAAQIKRYCSICSWSETRNRSVPIGLVRGTFYRDQH